MGRYRLLALAAAIGVARAPAFADEMHIDIEGLRSAKGTILVGLYDSKESFDRAIELAGKDGFLNDPQRVAGAALRANGDLRGDIVFMNLPPGRYAVIVLHDEDGNGRLDKNLLGVPTEAYGFSNGAWGFLGPPSFKNAAFEFGSGGMNLTITLVQPDAGVGSSRPSGGAEGAQAKPVNPGSGGGQ